MKYLAAIILFSFVANASVSSDFPSSTLRQASEAVKKLSKNASQRTYLSGTAGNAVLVEYSGKFRKLPVERAAFIAEYAKTRGKTGIADSFKNEVNVKENGAEYWLPIQEAFSENLKKELKKGQNFIAFLIPAGETQRGDIIFLMNDFDAAKADVDSFKVLVK